MEHYYFLPIFDFEPNVYCFGEGLYHIDGHFFQ
jgi:hypothetical protein